MLRANLHFSGTFSSVKDADTFEKFDISNLLHSPLQSPADVT